MADAKKDAKTRETFTVENLKGDWDKAVYLDSLHADNMMSALLAFGTEFWALKRRVMVMEKIMDDKKYVSREMIEAYKPSDAELAAWDTERDDFTERVFSHLTRTVSKKA
jgi:Trk K+ transport system NAD-binding subunit